jgi:hypothetical protein
MINQSLRILTYLRDHERLDLSRVGDMRADAEIDHRTTPVYRRGRAIRNLRLDKVLFVLIVLYIRRTSQNKVSGNTHGKIISKLTANISSNVSFGTTSRSNFCFSLIALSETFSRAG